MRAICALSAPGVNVAVSVETVAVVVIGKKPPLLWKMENKPSIALVFLCWFDIIQNIGRWETGLVGGKIVGKRADVPCAVWESGAL